ncbi:uncharacterized protein [Rhodnius prolixus]
MHFSTTSTTLSLLVLALFSLDGLKCARTTNRDRHQPSAPARTSSSKASSSNGSDESDLLTDECPEPNGYFADGYQCDKYYECVEGAINEKLCPDGMVFNDYSILHEKCDLPFNIDCTSRPQLQEPKPSLNCPRQNGYFAHENATICDKFYYCVDGKYNMITCPSGLVYNERTGICTWPDEAKKKHCSSEVGEEVPDRVKKRQKRESEWLSEEEEEEEDNEASASYEGSNEESDGDEEENSGNKRSSSESIGNDYYDDSIAFTSSESQFPTDDEFENFDAEFAEFGLSDEYVSSESLKKDRIIKRRRNDDDNMDELDDYVKEYVRQANKDGGGKAAGMDLRYYERIAEEAVKKEEEKKAAQGRTSEEAVTAKNQRLGKEAAYAGANQIVATPVNRTVYGLGNLQIYRCVIGVS